MIYNGFLDFSQEEITPRTAQTTRHQKYRLSKRNIADFYSNVMTHLKLDTKEIRSSKGFTFLKLIRVLNWVGIIQHSPLKIPTSTKH